MIPALYRKRLIPNECTPLKNDKILYMDDNILVTSWNTLKPRKDFHHGYSCVFFNEGIKISRFLREDNSLYHWYCDIITHEWSSDKKDLVIVDLLADVTVDADGRVNVLDIDELCEAKEKGFISDDQFFTSVKQLGNLISIIQHGRFSEYTDILMRHIQD